MTVSSLVINCLNEVVIFPMWFTKANGHCENDGRKEEQSNATHTLLAYTTACMVMLGIYLEQEGWCW